MWGVVHQDNDHSIDQTLQNVNLRDIDKYWSRFLMGFSVPYCRNVVKSFAVPAQASGATLPQLLDEVYRLYGRVPQVLS